MGKDIIFKRIHYRGMKGLYIFFLLFFSFLFFTHTALTSFSHGWKSISETVEWFNFLPRQSGLWQEYYKNKRKRAERFFRDRDCVPPLYKTMEFRCLISCFFRCWIRIRKFRDKICRRGRTCGHPCAGRLPPVLRPPGLCIKFIMEWPPGERERRCEGLRH